MRPRLPSNPSTSLPSPARLHGVSIASINSAVSILRRLYSPEVIGSASKSSTISVSFSTSPIRTKHSIPTDSGYGSTVGSDGEDANDQVTRKQEKEAWEALKADQYERAFAIRWLTSFVARAQDWINENEEDEEAKAEKETILEDASALLAACSGPSAVGTVSRVFTFGPTQPDPIRIELKDAPLSSQDHTGVGLQTWGSACVLSDRMVADPDHFGFCKEYASGRGLRVLEMGAGTGLLSLVAVKLLERVDANEEHRVFATDYHPSVLANLAINIQTNIGRDDECQGARLTQHFLDWTTPTHEWPFDEPFDIILGGDVVYEEPHAVLVRRTVVEYLRKPRVDFPDAVFHLMMPVRRTHRAETDTVHNIFPTRGQILANRLSTSQTDYQLAILEEERISRSAGVGRADEIEYRLWKIGWV